MKDSNIEKYINSVIEAVDILHEKALFGQVLTIIYSSIDACGLLDASAEQNKATGKTFKDWVNKYLLPVSSLECSADDLWGARCAVLHTHTAVSDLSKASKVKEIQYISGPPEHPLVIAFLKASKDIGEKESIGVNIDILLMDFLKAIEKFNTEFIDRIKTCDVLKNRASRVLLNHAM